ncbi:FxsB family cyclophane-forming radical SAM/SPASM peptide maturase [Spirillospora sp. CA-294931]|uniref:FxsB family cyclophane-forming radical SAM/SPASM peptide maturase n=1 Tax=Spirillospora sp. CA-294931 TaxID=3240042 RepID=UPI003D911390
MKALSESGWRPTPFHEFLLKVHSRCDLACDYCYMYEMPDQTWRTRPRRMSPDVIDHVAARVAQHAARHRLPSVRIVLHGGEPLLAGAATLAHAVTAVRRAVRPPTRVEVSLQTNAVRLDEAALTLLDELGVRIGVSLDGDAAAHDRHRRGPGGRGSHAAVRAALERLTGPRFRHRFGGLLCTVDLRNDPLDTYRALLEWKPPALDFLLPHGNWDTPPPGREPGSPATPYADWLIAIFDRWYDAPERETRVRVFDDVMRLLLGRRARAEGLGLGPTGTVVIETDGSIEQSDVLKSAYEGAPATGLHVSRDSLDAALLLPSIAARQIGVRALAPECLACPVREVCGAGLYAHRYRSGQGFANPSVYGPDLFRLIGHVRARMVRDIRELAVARCG